MSAIPDVPIVLLGFGNVGQSVAQLVKENDGYRSEGVNLILHSVFDRGGGVLLEGRETGDVLEAKRRERTVAALSGARAVAFEDALEYAGEGAILVDTSITDAATGGPGLPTARRALARGTSVVFASKGPLVRAQSELARLATSTGARIGASAAVGIPLPSVEVGLVGLRGAKVTRVRGILNDTANQILRDLEAGVTLEDAVERARLEGTIEEDPKLDLEGWDAAYKLLILARILWDPALRLEDATTRGVEAFGKRELDEARSQRKRIRLVATGERARGGPAILRTEPEALGSDDPFYALRPGEKAVVFETDAMGTMVVKSSKGGPAATAACAVKDVLNISAPARPFA